MCVWHPKRQRLQTGSGGANRRVREPVRLVCRVVTYSPAFSTFPGNLTPATAHLSSSPSVQFLDEICKQGDGGVWASCLEELVIGGTVFSHWNSGSCCFKIVWGWQPPDVLKKFSASFRELGERAGCESCSGWWGCFSTSIHYPAELTYFLYMIRLRCCVWLSSKTTNVTKWRPTWFYYYLTLKK